MILNLIKKILTSVLAAFISVSAMASPSTEGIQAYQKNMHLSPEHKQRLADDISRYRNADNLWDVLREEFTLPHYEDNPQVQEKIQWFMNNQDFLLRSATRAAPYLYYILQQVKKRHLPAELVLLPIVESGYNPFSLSHAGAAGIWQLMPGTASGYGVRQNGWYDGRRDVIASTRAALNYLAYLQTFFDGNWLLAIAAYNTGEGNVLSAIKRNIRQGYETSFWSLPVAQETRDYVPSLLALAVIISHPDRYPIYFPPVRNAPYLAQVDLGTPINLKEAADFAGISHSKLLQLNSGFKAATSAKGPYKLVLPIENVVEFTENYARSPFNHRQINWTHYRAKSGDTLTSIANRFNTTPKAIRKLNHLTKNTVRYGTNLLIPKNSDSSELTVDPSEIENTRTRVASSADRAPAYESPAMPAITGKKYALQAGDTVYMVRKKDTLEGIARKFHSTPAFIQVANQLRSRQLVPGKQLVIPTHSEGNEQLASARKLTKKLLPGDTVYMVRRGDSVEKIARRFHTTAAAVRVANLIDDSSLVEGARIVVPTHIRG